MSERGRVRAASSLCRSQASIKQVVSAQQEAEASRLSRTKNRGNYFCFFVCFASRPLRDCFPSIFMFFCSSFGHDISCWAEVEASSDSDGYPYGFTAPLAANEGLVSASRRAELKQAERLFFKRVETPTAATNVRMHQRKRQGRRRRSLQSFSSRGGGSTLQTTIEICAPKDKKNTRIRSGESRDENPRNTVESRQRRRLINVYIHQCKRAAAAAAATRGSCTPHSHGKPTVTVAPCIAPVKARTTSARAKKRLFKTNQPHIQHRTNITRNYSLHSFLKRLQTRPPLHSLCNKHPEMVARYKPRESRTHEKYTVHWLRKHRQTITSGNTRINGT